MSVMLVPFWNGLALTFGAALSNSTRERPCASLPVTTRRIGLMSLMRCSAGMNGSPARCRSCFAPLEGMEVRRAARLPRLFGDGVHVGDHVHHDRPVDLKRPLERAFELARLLDADAGAAERLGH